MTDPFVGEIRIFGFNFAPRSWAFCDGQILPIAQNTALFSLLGTTYGGNGQSTFALPNLQGRAPMHPGQGPGLSLQSLGESDGVQTVTVSAAQMPAHTHNLSASAGDGLERAPADQLFATGIGISAYAAPGALTPLNLSTTTQAGGGQAHNNLMPYEVLSFCIALQGIYPPRS